VFIGHAGLKFYELNKPKKLIKLKKTKEIGGIKCQDLPGQNILCLLQNW